MNLGKLFKNANISFNIRHTGDKDDTKGMIVTELLKLAIRKITKNIDSKDSKL